MIVQTTIGIGDIVNLIMVGALVGTTIWYAIRTHGLWREAVMTRQFQQPSLRLSPKGSFFPGVGIVNVGSAHAMDIHLVYEQVGSPACRMKLSIPVLAPGASFDVPVQKGVGHVQWEQIEKDNLVVHLEGSCRDSVGNEVPVSHKVSLTEYIRQAKKVDSTMLSFGDRDDERRFQQDMVSQLRDIAKALGGGPFGGMRSIRG
jgi:hypothetical protein